MKASENFKIVIENYLKEKALNDIVFASAFAKPTKNIEQCIKYIISEVKKTGLCAFADNEIFDIAVQYYNSDDCISEPVETNCKVMVSQFKNPDLFSAPIETAKYAVQKTLLKETPKPVQTVLTLFDL